MDDWTYCQQTLPKVSRTFALNIKTLKGELHRSVLIAYLFCRTVDTVEDAAELDPKIVPRDVASREIYDIVYNQKMGVDGDPMVYLDLTHKSREFLDNRLGGIMDIYTKFTGVDPREHPMKIFPAVHYSMGGLWTDFGPDQNGLIDHGSPRNQMTSIKGLFAAGEADYQYHGANRLGANSLLSCIYTGLMMARGIMNYTDSLEKSVDDIPSTVFDEARNHWKNRFKKIKKMDGPENPYQLHQELGEIMLANVLIVRDNKSLKKATDEINDIETRFKDINCVDSSDWANPCPSFINQLFCMIHLSKIITKGALLRNEFRGSHYKPDFDLTQPKDFDPHEYIEYLEQKQYGDISEDKFPPGHLDYMKRFEENNVKWLKTTVAQFKDNQPDITYDEVNTSLITPRPRKYD